MKKTLSIILLISMLATLFSGCSLFGDKLTGTWESEVDLTAFMMDGIKDSLGETGDEIFSTLEVKDLKITSRITFNDDGSYEISADSDSVTAMIKSFIDQLVSGVSELFTMMAADKDIDNSSISEIIDGIRNILEKEYNEEAVAKIVQNFSKKGFFKASDGKLYTADTEEGLDSAGFEAYELNDNTLTLNKGEGYEDVYSEAISSLYPLVYTRKAE